jgi:type I restriction enzyme, S subunit
MSKLKKLKNIASYSNTRIKVSEVSIDNFITTDNLLQNKAGITRATNLPPQEGGMPAFQKNDILIGNIRPYLKKIWFSDRDGGASADVLVLNVDESYDPKYVYYALFRDDFFDHVMKGSKGTKMPRGDKNQVLEFLIPDFDLPTQQKIASFLSSLDAKIELNNRINAELEAMAKTLYDYWFVQFDFPDAAGKPYKLSGGAMVWSEGLKREIPLGWGMNKLDNVIDIILDHRGKTPLKLGGNWVNQGEGVIAISAKHVKNGKLEGLDTANRVGFDMFEKWMPEKLIDGDILMTSEAPLGEFFFILNYTNYCMSQRLFAIRADKQAVLPLYLFYELSKGNGYSQIIGSKSGSTVFGIRQNELRKINILKPDLRLQKEFEKTSLPMIAQIRINEQENQQLTHLRDWLLPMLMNGQVMVE